MSTPPRPAVFLDKDGTLLVDVPYNVDPALMRWAPGAASAVRRLAAAGLPMIVISNQPGVALGRFPPAALQPMWARMATMFEEAGARLAGAYCCMHHPEGRLPEWTRRCDCRKPAPGLVLRAAREHAVDLSRSWFVGDILNDVEAGRRAGCRAALIDNGNETEWEMSPWREPHVTVPDLDAAADAILAHCASRADAPFLESLP